ncbi:MAG: phosphatidate cytidylyltransferase [Nitriliruptorales bacterium]|nr:phosphatidate cytidylyltransferase [Nitriliruptorales bacterium]
MSGEPDPEPSDAPSMPDPPRSANGDPTPAGEAPPPAPAGRNLPLAIASGVVLAGLFLLTLWLNDYAFLVFVAVIVIIGLLEVAIALRERGLRPATPVAIGAGLVMFFGAYVAGPVGQVLGLVLLVFGALTWLLSDRGRSDVTASLGATFLMTLWVPFCGSFIGLLLDRPDGAWYVIAVVAMTVAADIGAYALGSRFGRHKLAPSVSPGKTWEGLLGALVTVLVLAVFMAEPLVPGLNLVEALILGAGILFAATLGDLSESLVKRDLGVKDLGRVLPGHGGIMDRMDALLFTLPTTHLILLALGL